MWRVRPSRDWQLPGLSLGRCLKSLHLPHSWQEHTCGRSQDQLSVTPAGGQRDIPTPPLGAYNSDFPGFGKVSYPPPLAFKDDLCPVYMATWFPSVVIEERLVCLRWNLPKSMLLYSSRIIAWKRTSFLDTGGWQKTRIFLFIVAASVTWTSFTVSKNEPCSPLTITHCLSTISVKISS